MSALDPSRTYRVPDNALRRGNRLVRDLRDREVRLAELGGTLIVEPDIWGDVFVQATTTSHCGWVRASDLVPVEPEPTPPPADDLAARLRESVDRSFRSRAHAAEVEVARLTAVLDQQTQTLTDARALADRWDRVHATMSDYHAADLRALLDGSQS